MKKYGLMGGTFDPIHLGHLMISEYVKEDLGLDEIIFIPTGNPPHKTDYLPADQRYNMVSIAIRENQDFKISDVETKRVKESYSIETINILKEELQGDLYFIIGSDSLFDLKNWKDIEKLATLVDFACAVRPHYALEKEIKKEIDYLDKKYHVRVHMVDSPLYDISSTKIRKRLKEKKSVKYIVPDEVIDYIDENNLYRG
ncbi:nicotinate-nucleotide adenylyltransferase [Peptoniphilus stercorisuis]|uniref:Probable nicotinate-nucleotide adenylyltransferase n=1 Tax=Peptoniphilus stercorisuis TaxID=1436965 RepID=A0ABS4KCG2_9FIRM|nr:nicotinate-nucleotide adenylyltransferase [Peptoniphilus stercorisuis]MBP2025454.1 nicotinate-nucleotide adenylyltransferase [Peptoniphilus stercorisuis]